MVMTRQTIDDQWLGSERHLKYKLNRPWKQATSIRECVSRISLSRPKEARNNKAKKPTSPICHALQCQKNQSKVVSSSRWMICSQLVRYKGIHASPPLRRRHRADIQTITTNRVQSPCNQQCQTEQKAPPMWGCSWWPMYQKRCLHFLRSAKITTIAPMSGLKPPTKSHNLTWDGSMVTKRVETTLINTART